MRRPLFHLNHYPINSYHPTKAVSRLQRVSNRPRRFACCPTVFRGRSAGPGGAPPTRPVWAIRLESRQGHPARGPLPLLLTSPAVTAVPQWAACTALRCGTAQCGTLVWNTAQGDSNQNAGGPGDPSSPRRSHPGSTCSIRHRLTPTVGSRVAERREDESGASPCRVAIPYSRKRYFTDVLIACGVTNAHRSQPQQSWSRDQHGRPSATDSLLKSWAGVRPRGSPNRCKADLWVQKKGHTRRECDPVYLGTFSDRIVVSQYAQQDSNLRPTD